MEPISANGHPCSQSVVNQLRPVVDEVQAFSAWNANCEAVTPGYVPNEKWNEIQERVRQHVQFSKPCIDGRQCLPINGSSGVGKTRLVFEALKEIPFVEAIVDYTSHEDIASRMAAKLTNYAESTVVIVAVECSSQTIRHNAIAKLPGH